jgi:hypothetical protein
MKWFVLFCELCRFRPDVIQCLERSEYINAKEEGVEDVRPEEWSTFLKYMCLSIFIPPGIIVESACLFCRRLSFLFDQDYVYVYNPITTDLIADKMKTLEVASEELRDMYVVKHCWEGM